ncbi:MAG: hypothetical protein SGBAC_005036 [Bacillariaceae sp.]
MMFTRTARNATIAQQEQPLDKYVVCKDENDCTEATETSSECFSSATKPQRRISFAPYMDVCDIPSREDMTNVEYCLSFYSPDEIALLNDEHNETADRMDSGKKAKKSAPYRGLESWTQKGQRDMNARIFSCMDSVLNEQDKQWADDRNSTRRIAKASKSLTKTSRNRALEFAKQDEKEARKVYEEHLEGNDEEEDEPHIPLRAVIRQSTIMKSKKTKGVSGRSVDGGSSHSRSLGMSIHSHDSCDSALWSLSSNSVFDKQANPPKKRKSKKKSPAREGKTLTETPAKTPASRRKKIKKVIVV